MYEPASVCYSRLAQSHSSVQETYCNYEENLRVGKYEIKRRYESERDMIKSRVITKLHVSYLPYHSTPQV